MTAAETLALAVTEIRQAVGIVALLHAGDELRRADVQAAVALVQRRLDEIAAAGLMLQRQPPAFGSAEIPILTLTEVAARARHRARPALRLVANEGDAA